MSYKIINYMQQLPDIKTLYQRKYIQPFSRPEQFHPTNPQQMIIHKAQRFHERIILKPSPNKKLNCIKIVKQQQKPMRYDSNQDQSHQQKTPIKRYSSTANNKPSHNISNKSSSESFRPKNQLIKQLMKVSQQQLSDLQSSFGGQKKLMSLLNIFFQKRHEAHRMSKHSRNISEFKPMNNLFKQLRYKEQQDKLQQFRISKQYINVQQQKKLKQKDLAPWSVQDLQFA